MGVFSKFGNWLEQNAMYGMTPSTFKRNPGVGIELVILQFNLLLIKINTIFRSISVMANVLLYGFWSDNLRCL